MADHSLNDLLERVKRASASDRCLDRDIYWSLERQRAERSFWNAAITGPKPLPDVPWHELPAGLGRLAIQTDAPKYTWSIDAALALVERKLPGWFFGCQRNKTRPDPPDRAWSAWVSSGTTKYDEVEALGHTLPLAILAALLTALSPSPSPALIAEEAKP
jgi:hypothetical protein